MFIGVMVSVGSRVIVTVGISGVLVTVLVMVGSGVDVVVGVIVDRKPNDMLQAVERITITAPQ
ncbi:MAG TPA: hypothetical protein VN376_10480, partial [Longilinea sp.]|nr:hypothetical protein [Longilinea sp.]